MALRRGGRRELPAEQAGDPRAVSNAAAALLARRDYASAELRQKLLDKGFADDAVDSVLAGLIEQRYVDDARYAERFVAYQSRRGHGPGRIRQDLRRWLEGATIEQALQAGPDWAVRAREVRSSRFGPVPPEDWQEKGRQARFLQYRGFSSDHIRLALGSDFDESGD
ncbi:MAG TPA: regulatory protein RecX [Steroidobacteraceae bacterium]|nr:regulatory protein RecX [Steroidobacteraceae bacterium]HRX90698.1 regulatory protein RecX [Steroidobacteraceae bacterium]